MIWSNIKSLLNSGLSAYCTDRTKLMRRGKYTSGDHFQDGYIAMLHETIQEMDSTDDFYPLDKKKTRELINAFNKLTSQNVLNIWSPDPIPPDPLIKYGHLYNYYSITDSRGICGLNAHIPTQSEWQSLFTFVADGGKSLKEPGSVYWNFDEGTNLYGFNARGNGFRSKTVDFVSLTDRAYYWTNTDPSIIGKWTMAWLSSFHSSLFADQFKLDGAAIRLIVDSPIEVSGDSAIYVGNNGRRYSCIKINSIWWLAENLAETEYANGDLIPTEANLSTWNALTSGAKCAYDNDDTNVFIYI